LSYIMGCVGVILMSIKVSAMAGDTFGSSVFTVGRTDPGTVNCRVTGQTTGRIMNLATSCKRCGGRGMTTVTIRGDRSLQCVGTEGMSMTMVIEVTGMTILAVTAVDTVQAAAYCTAVSS
jgi:hypothetical protein